MKRSLLIAIVFVLVACQTRHRDESSLLDRAMAQVDSMETPVKRIAVTSATQVGMLYALGATDRMVAVANGGLMYHLDSLQRDTLVELGNDYEMNIERLILVHPDVVLLTDYGFRTPGIDRVEQAGIRVLYLNEWREQDPLSRAGWLRLMARLTDTEERADSLLAVVRAEYERLCALVPQDHSRSLATGQSYRGTWYVPTGQTYMGQLIADAGANYRYSEHASTESLPLTEEEALMTLGDADVWVGVQAHSLSELATIDGKHTWMRAYRMGQVYSWNRQVDPTGANDFWETGVVRPDYILNDLIWALYPECLPEDYVPHFILPLGE